MGLLVRLWDFVGVVGGLVFGVVCLIFKFVLFLVVL